MSPELPADQAQQRFTLREILTLYPGLRADRLRCLERWNLICPAFRASGESSFSFADLAVIRQASAALGRGVSFRGVLRWLQAARDGQLALDFAGNRTSAELVVLPRPSKQGVPPETGTGAVASHADLPLMAAGPSPSAVDEAEEDFNRAVALDDQDPAQQEEAARLYRNALESDPRCVPALVNLANIHYARGNLVEAEMLYARALAIDARVVEAHFNLGNLHYDLEHLEHACACYERALVVDATFADAHFYLAVTLERLGRSDDARPHWRAYRNLAPNGEWATLAKEFTDS
jgi:tetratricopeptide (TPR) repeat protein